MIQRRSNVGSGFKKNWSIGLLLPPGLSIIFFRLTFVNLGYTAIFFQFFSLEEKLRVRNTFLNSHFQLLHFECFDAHI